MDRHIIKRDEYLNKLVEKMDNGLIKVITGLRRSGKTFLLFTIFKDYLLSKGVDPASIICISMEGYGNKKYRDSEYFYNYVNECIKGGGHYYLFVDEVGLLSDYVEVINGLNLLGSIDIYITGSNAYSLSSDIITTFRGRSDQIYLSPLSFKEYYSSTSDMGKKEALEEYLDYGGLPKLKEYPSYDSKKTYLESIYKEAYLRDVKERHHIRNDNNIEILINILASTSGSLVNPTNIQKAYLERGKVSIKVNTIRKYLKYLEDAFIIKKVDRYDIRGNKYITAQSKYYFTDLGIRNAILNFRQMGDSRSLENLVYNELVIQGYSVDIGMISSYKSKKGLTNLEVDFIARKYDRLYYIQVSSYLDEEKYLQESASLKEINDSFKKIIICKEGVSESHYSEDGILLLSLTDFLLDEKSLNI